MPQLPSLWFSGFVSMCAPELTYMHFTQSPHISEQQQQQQRQSRPAAGSLTNCTQDSASSSGALSPVGQHTNTALLQGELHSGVERSNKKKRKPKHTRQQQQKRAKPPHQTSASSRQAAESQNPMSPVSPCFLVGYEQLLPDSLAEVLLINLGSSQIHALSKSLAEGWCQSWEMNFPRVNTMKSSRPWKSAFSVWQVSVQMRTIPFIRHLSCLYSRTGNCRLALLLRVNAHTQVTFRSSVLLCRLDQGWHSQVKTNSFTYNRVKLT